MKGREIKVLADFEPGELDWKLLMRVPEFIGEEDLAAARAQ